LKIVLISKPEPFLGETELINQIMQVGSFNFHLRKKSLDEKEVRKIIYKIQPEFYPRIVIHQGFEMEKEFGLGGIHLPENERHNYERLKAEEHKIISTSIHRLNEFDALRRNFRYIFFSPLFPSISKPDAKPLYAADEIKEQLKEIKNKSNLFALGGIDAGRLEDVRALGFEGLGLLGYIWESKSPVKTFQEFLRLESGTSR
jgi:thiamine monophosphate synthase